MLGLGLAIPEVARRGGVDAAAWSLIARMSVPPPAARVAAIDALVRALKSAGVWAKLDALWVIAAHDAQAARLNWTGGQATLAPVGGPVFTVDRGYAGDGIASHLDTGYNPAAAGLPLDGCALGVWCRGTADHASALAFGMFGSGNRGFYMSPMRSGAAHGRVNQAVAATNASVASAQGLTLLDRSAANVVRIYRTGGDIGGDATASSGPVQNMTMLLGAINNAGAPANFDGRQYAAALVARASLGAAQHQALHAALATYLGGIGAA